MKKIQLTQGKVALVDDEDFDELSKFSWYAHRCTENIFYAEAYVNGKVEKMHRFIMKFPKSFIDHMDRNSLNNQRKNLRLCTHSQNIANSKLSKKNTSGYRGVRFHKYVKKFEARIGKNNILHNIGYFKDPIDAAKAYDKKAIELHGEFAGLNFPEVKK